VPGPELGPVQVQVLPAVAARLPTSWRLDGGWYDGRCGAQYAAWNVLLEALLALSR